MPSIKRKNQYQIAKDEGRLGSLKDLTWNKKLYIHVCCKTRHPWYHRKNCPVLNDSSKKLQIYSEQKKAISAMRRKGLTSLEVSKTLNLPIDKVNAAWSI